MNGYIFADTTVNFTPVSIGYARAILYNDNNYIPIIRDNLNHTGPMIEMPDEYKSIILCMGACAESNGFIKPIFNNVMIEKCSRGYKGSEFWSHPAMDVAENTIICIKSLYQNYKLPPTRKLVVMDKQTKMICEFILEHNSLVIIPPGYNRTHTYKIIPTDATDDNDWIGITARESHTFITDSSPPVFVKLCDFRFYNYTNAPVLTFADYEQENEYVAFCDYEKSYNGSILYPHYTYTTSPGLLLAPV